MEETTEISSRYELVDPETPYIIKRKYLDVGENLVWAGIDYYTREDLVGALFFVVNCAKICQVAAKLQ